MIHPASQPPADPAHMRAYAAVAMVIAAILLTAVILGSAPTRSVVGPPTGPLAAPPPAMGTSSAGPRLAPAGALTLPVAVVATAR